jgi:hypothetical protein
VPEVAWSDLHLHLIGDVVTLPPLADITTLAPTDIDRERMRTSEVAADQVPNTADCRRLVTINRRLPCAVPGASAIGGISLRQCGECSSAGVVGHRYVFALV